MKFFPTIAFYIAIKVNVVPLNPAIHMNQLEMDHVLFLLKIFPITSQKSQLSCQNIFVDYWLHQLWRHSLQAPNSPFHKVFHNAGMETANRTWALPTDSVDGEASEELQCWGFLSLPAHPQQPFSPRAAAGESNLGFPPLAGQVSSILSIMVSAPLETRVPTPHSRLRPQHRVAAAPPHRSSLQSHRASSPHASLSFFHFLGCGVWYHHTVELLLSLSVDSNLTLGTSILYQVSLCTFCLINNGT